MQKKLSYIKHTVLLVAMIGVIALLAFTLERSEINDITTIKIKGNKYLDSQQYLKFANLERITEENNLNINLIQDRLEKHPYVKNADVIILERGIVEVTIKEKNIEALLFSSDKQFLITSSGEVLPSLAATKNINFPIIIDKKGIDIKIFNRINNKHSLSTALRIISAAEVYDKELCENISEINVNKNESLTLNITGIPFPVYLGKNNEIAKTVYLSRVLKHLNKNNISKYLSYIDLRFDDLVYLGFKEKLSQEKERI